MNTLNNSQIVSIVGAVLSIIVGGAGIALQWFSVPEGLALIMAGLSILGVHTGGSVAGARRMR